MPRKGTKGLLQGAEHRRGHIDFRSALPLQLFDQLFLLSYVLLGQRNVAIGLI